MADSFNWLGRSVLGGGGGWRKECIGEVYNPICAGGDWVVEVNYSNHVDLEGEGACVDDAIDDSYKAGEVGDLVAASGGADGNLDDNNWAGDVLASPDLFFI